MESNIRGHVHDLIAVSNRADSTIERLGDSFPGEKAEIQRLQKKLVFGLSGPIPLEEVRSRIVEPMLSMPGVSDGAKMAVRHVLDTVEGWRHEAKQKRSSPPTANADLVGTVQRVAPLVSAYVEPQRVVPIVFAYVELMMRLDTAREWETTGGYQRETTLPAKKAEIREALREWLSIIRNPAARGALAQLWPKDAEGLASADAMSNLVSNLVQGYLMLSYFRPDADADFANDVGAAMKTGTLPVDFNPDTDFGRFDRVRAETLAEREQLEKDVARLGYTIPR